MMHYATRRRRNPEGEVRLETRSVFQRVHDWAFGSRRIEVRTDRFTISAPTVKDVEDVLAILAQHDASKLGVGLGPREEDD